MVGRLFSFWDGNFWGAMLNFRWVFDLWIEVWGLKFWKRVVSLISHPLLSIRCFFCYLVFVTHCGDVRQGSRWLCRLDFSLGAKRHESLCFCFQIWCVCFTNLSSWWNRWNMMERMILGVMTQFQKSVNAVQTLKLEDNHALDLAFLWKSKRTMNEVHIEMLYNNSPLNLQRDSSDTTLRLEWRWIDKNEPTTNKDICNHLFLYVYIP